MPFASAKDATNSKGELKAGYSKITDKNGRVKYMRKTVKKDNPADNKVKKVKGDKDNKKPKDNKKATKKSKKSKKELKIPPDPPSGDSEEFIVKLS